MDAPDSQRAPRRALLKSHGLFMVIFLFACIVNLSIRLLNLPLNRIMELRYCRDYYLQHDPSVVGPGGDVEERLCKVGEVQEKLAWLSGFVDTSIIICDLAMALPFGVISDRLGRRLVLALNSLAATTMFAWFLFVGKSNTIPVEAMIAAPYLALFGGGSCVLTSILFACLADIAPDAETRMTYFSYISSLSYVFALLGPILASATMSIHLWLPYYIGLGLSICALPILLLLPEKRPTVMHREGNTCALGMDPSQAVDETTPLIPDASQQNGARPDAPASVRPKPTTLSKVAAEVKDIGRLVTGRPNFSKLILITVLLSVGSSNIAILLPYLSKRYERTFAEVGYVLSVKAAANVLVLIGITPSALKAWIRRHPDAQVEFDLYGLGISVFLLATGSLCLGMATTLSCAITAIVIYGLGTASGIFILSLSKSPIVSGDNDDSARVFSIIVILRTVGELIGVPLMTVSWAKGIEWGGIFLGMPYFTSLVFYLLVLVGVWYLFNVWTKSIK